MIIRPLLSFDVAQFAEVARGYVSTQHYVVHKEETDALTTFTMVLEALDVPCVKKWADDPPDYEEYRKVVAEQGLSLGVYEDDRLIGVAIAERRDWNRSLWIWEFHIHEDYRGRGIGRQLMDTLADTARGVGLHTMSCETQNTNVGAVRFYRRVGFTIDGIDVSLYSPEIDEIAFFMRRPVTR